MKYKSIGFYEISLFYGLVARSAVVLPNADTVEQFESALESNIHKACEILNVWLLSNNIAPVTSCFMCNSPACAICKN